MQHSAPAPRWIACAAACPGLSLCRLSTLLSAALMVIGCVATTSWAIEGNEPIEADGFPAEYPRFVSEHFVLVSHAHADLARARLELLEKTYARFYDAFEKADFEPQPTRTRLIAVLFDKHDAYVQYATDADRIDMSWTNGYYSARTNRVALVLAGDERIATREPVQTAATDREDQLLPFAESATATQAARPVEVSVSMRPISIASTAHEAAHQLAFNSGLQQRGVMYPLWVSEGLASCFEPQSIDDLFGPEHVNESRRRDLIDAMDAGTVIPLNDFVALTRLPTNDARAVSHVYAQGWALFHFLFENHPKELKQYMKKLTTLRPGRRSVSTMRQEFIAAFGPIEKLQAKWDEALLAHQRAEREHVAQQADMVALESRK